MQLLSHAKDTQPEQPLLPGEVEGVRYPDAASLDRPTSHGLKHVPFIAASVIASIAVAAFLIHFAYQKIVVEPDTELQRTIDAIEADVDFNFPMLLDVIDLGDAEMVAALRAAGNTLVMLEEYPEDPEESEGFDLYRIPETVNERTAATYLDNGISSLKRLQGATFLNGSWRYTVYRYLTYAVRLQYADFSVTTPEAAIAHAMELQGWMTDEVAEELGWNWSDSVTAGEDEAGDGEEGGEDEPASEPADVQDAEGDGEEPSIEVILGESGKDTSGNTYQTGTIIIEGHHYGFRISTVTIEEMYGLDLPREGMFVGVRVTNIILGE